MTKEPAGWAKVKAYRVVCSASGASDESILNYMSGVHSGGVYELARMYDTYEQPPVDPDLLAAREYLKGFRDRIDAKPIDKGVFDGGEIAVAFLAGIKHGRANP